MPRSATPQAARQATNITLPKDLLLQARELGLTLSKACEQGLQAEIARSREARWLAENREALAASNDYVAHNGLPLSEFGQF